MPICHRWRILARSSTTTSKILLTQSHRAAEKVKGQAFLERTPAKPIVRKSSDRSLLRRSRTESPEGFAPSGLYLCASAALREAGFDLLSALPRAFAWKCFLGTDALKAFLTQSHRAAEKVKGQAFLERTPAKPIVRKSSDRSLLRRSRTESPEGFAPSGFYLCASAALREIRVLTCSPPFPAHSRGNAFPCTTTSKIILTQSHRAAEKVKGQAFLERTPAKPPPPPPPIVRKSSDRSLLRRSRTESPEGFAPSGLYLCASAALREAGFDLLSAIPRASA